MTKPILRVVSDAKPIAKRKSAKAIKTDRTALYAGVSFGTIALAGMALSLSHQAHGVINSTSAAVWEGWSMGGMIDAAFIAAKLVPYIAKDAKQREAVEHYAKPLAIGVLVLSAYFNAAGFSGYVPTGYVKGAIDIILGCAAPMIIYALSQMAAILLIGKAK